jgi:hypothetical protein
MNQEQQLVVNRYLASGANLVASMDGAVTLEIRKRRVAAGLLCITVGMVVAFFLSLWIGALLVLLGPGFLLTFGKERITLLLLPDNGVRRADGRKVLGAGMVSIWPSESTRPH